MKICIIGSGSVGSVIGAKLIAFGEEVTLIARGSHLEAIQQQGLCLRLVETGSEGYYHPTLATENWRKITPQDLIIVSTKAYSLPKILPDLSPLYQDHTALVIVQNGLPWWYFYQHGGSYEGRILQSVDPDGILLTQVAMERVIACVAYIAAEQLAPGLIQHGQNFRFILGELDGSSTGRLQILSDLFQKAGLNPVMTPDIRQEIWTKLWANVPINPISALTGATQAAIIEDSLTYAVVQSIMQETQQVAESLGIQFPVSIEERLKRIQSVGFHRTSMLQDLNRHRPMEIEAIIGAVVELANWFKIPVPHIQTLYATLTLLEKTLDHH
jgi:2-dehydropantoate 2-reductase